MPGLNVKVNTFFQKKHRKLFIDPISKLYIVTANMLGLNRLPVILIDAKLLGSSLAVVYSVFFSAGLLFMAYIGDGYTTVTPIMGFIEYMFHITFSFITWKRIKRYYIELNNFDAKIGCRPNVTCKSITNLILMVSFNVIFTFFFWVVFVTDWRNNDSPSLNVIYANIPVNLLHALEVYYFGHLISLLVPRMSLINSYVETALSDGKSAMYPNVKWLISFENNKNIELLKLMDLYYILIKAYDFLNDAIKWQLLVVLMTTFIATLTYSRRVSLNGISGKVSLVSFLTELGLACSKLLPLFSPCIFSDLVRSKVGRLRQLLTTRLYENKLDKSGRSAARALLMLTEARDLSFWLLRMLRVDLSLPIKFIGLLVTYLIILLQFEKVINPPQTPS